MHFANPKAKQRLRLSLGGYSYIVIYHKPHKISKASQVTWVSKASKASKKSISKAFKYTNQKHTVNSTQIKRFICLNWINIQVTISHYYW